MFSNKRKRPCKCLLSQLGQLNTPTESLQRGITSPNSDTKQYDREVPVMLELWGI